jgi:dipeptidyl aminopeptidase/acylaminoacyl peptidase
VAVVLAKRPAGLLIFLLLVLPIVTGAAAAQESAGTQEAVAAAPEDAYVKPDAYVEELFGRNKNYATLDNLSPDGRHFLVPELTELSTLERMAETTYRLAMLEIRPRVDRLWHLDTYGIYHLKIYSLDERSFLNVDLPDDIFVSDMTWSPDGGRIAFLAHLRDGTQVWTADAATGATTVLSDAPVLATIAARSPRTGPSASRLLQWTPTGSVITLLVPPDRGAEPERNPVPSSPMIRRTRDGATRTRTLPFLLRDDHDTALFKHYTTSQIAELAPGRAPRLIGEPRIYTSISLSPDGEHLLTQRVDEPFSYLTGYSGFPQKTEVLALDGTTMATVLEQPLREGGGGPRGGGDRNQPRQIAWRPDGAGLSYLQREPRPERGEGDEANAAADDEESGAAADETPRLDRIMLLAAPFDMNGARVVVASEDAFASVVYSRDGRQVFAARTKDDERELLSYDLTVGDPQPNVLIEAYDPQELTELPGDLMTKTTGNGVTYALMSSDGNAVYLEGPGYKEDFRPQPFVDRVTVADAATDRIFEGSRDSFETPLVALDENFQSMIVSRESKTDNPDSYLWRRDGSPGSMVNLTNNVDPFPEITAAERVDFEFTRRDGLKIQGRISLPVGYEEGTRVPAMFWTYPREFNNEEDYERSAVRGRNHNAFTPLSYLRWSDIWLTQGYALVYPDIPIIGEPFNDHFVQDLVDSMYAAIRKVDQMGYVDVDKIGHGGHSYGAFATGNILAHSPFFKAGIAGDGAYNRSLTPMGFQSEPRDIWEAPQIYFEISPFFSADKIDTPVLIYHGADDNNSGTYPVQSERFMQALTGLGKTAVLYMYPFESHTPRAIENKLDMWARFIDWFDRYVKGEG